MAGRRHTDLLWTKYFSDPSQWWDNRHIKAHTPSSLVLFSQSSSNSPYFKHKITKEVLWIDDGLYTPSWVREELRRRGILISSTKVNQGTVCSAKEDNDTDSKAISLSFMTALKACSKTKDLSRGIRIHADICNSGLLEKNRHLGNMVVSMYAKCGAFVRAQQVLDELPVRDIVSWNALIVGYVQQGQGTEALDCFHRMQGEGLSPNAITYACILKACGITQESDMGAQIHEKIASLGLLEKDVVLGNALVDMYAKCGLLTKAQKVLDELPVRDVVSWSALITGYAQHGQGKEALHSARQMQSEGLTPNAITYACILKACGIMQDADMGKQIHDEIISQGLLQNDVVLGNALIDMYFKCGLLAKAQKVLGELSVRNVVSWNALIGGYAQLDQGKEALDCFHQMQSEGFSPNAITYASVLKACGITKEADMGKKFHDEIVSEGLLEKDVILGNALVDMYAKCGVLTKSQEVLDELPIRDVVSWSALITGYVNHGQGKEALDCFLRMRSEGLSPDAVTYACILKACGIVLDADMGKTLHDEIVSHGLLEKNAVLGTALVDMYAKCGVLMKAQKVLNELPVRNLPSWSALIAGYAQHGQSKEALNCFQQMRLEGFSPDVISWSALIGGYAQQGLAEEALDCFKWMQQEGTSPNAITFVSVLNACSHSGLVDEGQIYFENMKKKYGITPDKEHYTCMVDLFGRARHFDKAIRVIKMMPSSDYLPVWSALLGACRKWGNVKLGRLAFEHAIQLDGHNAAAYVIMTNIYEAAGMKEDAQNIERMRVQNASWKQPGHSCWVDASGNIHKFVAGDTKHRHNRHIYAKLQDLELKLSQQRYSSNLQWTSENISHDSKKVLVCQHSEKLAIACAIINTPQGKDVRIMKNVRVCEDCHVAISLISKIEKRKIMVKDPDCLHVFEGGKCSCGDSG